MLNQFLALGPLATITIVSLFISLIITLIYKFTTDQKAMASLKDEMNRLRKELKDSKDPKKIAEINGKLMEKTMSQFRASMKPMIITMLPALLVLGWMQSTLAYQQLIPGEEFTTTAIFEKNANGEIELISPAGIRLMSEPKQKAAEKAMWKLKGSEGTYELEYHYGNEVYARDIIITKEWEYRDNLLEKDKSFLGMNTGDKYPIKKESLLKQIRIDHKPVHPLGAISLFGWQPGWLGTYIILSLVFSMLLRAALKVN